MFYCVNESTFYKLQSTICKTRTQSAFYKSQFAIVKHGLSPRFPGPVQSSPCFTNSVRDFPVQSSPSFTTCRISMVAPQIFLKTTAVTFDTSNKLTRCHRHSRCPEILRNLTYTLNIFCKKYREFGLARPLTPCGEGSSHEMATLCSIV
jgi:hypothetical protein